MIAGTVFVLLPAAGVCWTPAIAKDVPFGADNLYSVVLEVPDADLHSVAHSGQISSWALVILATDAGGWDCVNRVGLPMIQPIYAQLDDALATALNTEDPRYDRKLFADQIAKETAAVVAAYGTAADPAAYGRAVADKFLPNVLALHHRHRRRVRLRHLGWPLADRQRPRRRVLPRHQHRLHRRPHRELGPRQAHADVPLRAGDRLRTTCHQKGAKRCPTSRSPKDHSAGGHS